MDRNQEPPANPEDEIRKLQKEQNRLLRTVKRHETQLQHLDKMASANEKTNIALYKELEVLQQQAEAQAREAQIEAALERVRSHTMAMHSSNELADVAAVLFQQVKALGVETYSSGFNLWDKEHKEIISWMSNPEGSLNPPFKMPIRTYEENRRLYTSWKEKDDFYVDDIFGADLQRHYKFLRSFPLLDEAFKKAENAGIKTPDRQVHNIANFSHGNLLFITSQPCPEYHDIFKRFAKVFDQTYTRFLDLQQAEARAREAEQRASLDRIRAEIASMRTVEDLQRITPLIWRELTTLGVPFFRCGVFIIDEATEHAHVYLSTPSGEAVAALHLKFDSAPVVTATVQHWRQQQVYREEWNREQFIAWTQSILKQGLIDSSEKYQGGGESPEKLVLHFMPFTQGMLYIGSSAALSDDEIVIGQSLAKAFGVAYARYEDFQRLETAKAQVEAALENLKKTQGQLVQAEKMASLGQLTAGIAHEIKNPLNFVNNFAALSVDLAAELREGIVKRKT